MKIRVAIPAITNRSSASFAHPMENVFALTVVTISVQPTALTIEKDKGLLLTKPPF
jgi:hypothetical protein